MGAPLSVSWADVASILRRRLAASAEVPQQETHLDEGQRDSLAWMAERLPHTGVVLADEVGTGKTRIACAIVHAVLEAGGRAAVVVPHGLMHQWSQESRALHAGSPEPKRLTTLTEYLREASSEVATTGDLRPRPDRPEWWLVSHGFRAPSVRINSDWWRASLPALVELHLASRAEREDARTRIGQLHDFIEGEAASCPEWTGMARIAKELLPLIRGRRDLRRRIEALPPLGIARGSNDALLRQFGGDGDGRRLTEELLGLWLGEFDLLVIDEAHKGRSETEGADAVVGTLPSRLPGTVLTRLVDRILQQPESGRRLCLTATPMELELLQWLDLLGRARCGLERERGLRVVQRLHVAASHAARAPDEGDRLDELCAAAREFTTALRPYVTRRRRDEEPLIGRFREAAGIAEDRPHPHRRIEQVRIGWTDASDRRSPWLDVLFAAECMSHSARGLSLKDTAAWPRAVREAYTKLAAGHVSMDFSETSEPLRVPEAGVVDAFTRGKMARTAYWFRLLRERRKRAMEGVPRGTEAAIDPDAEHPRLLAAVRGIERWTLAGEKVLVFGVFLRPLRLLRDVVNVRHALRAADAGRPISHAVHADAGLLGIAARQADRLREEGLLHGRLADADGSDVRRALVESHMSYERLRTKIRRRARRSVNAWCGDPAILGGPSIGGDLEQALEDHFASFILDDVLAATTESDEVPEDRAEALTAEFAERHLRPVLGELSNEDAKADHAVRRQEALRALVEEDDGRQSFHARLLQGATRWETRHYLQAAFNRRRAAPWVLLAQSQVGREGLNLHEACRVVLQFHAEWNPAILEQQIGRVDRKGSLWEERARSWIEGGAQGDPPFIEVRQLIFEGTYDAFQWDRVMRRQRIFDASLFGSLLPVDAWHRVPLDRVGDLRAAAPSFRPAPAP